jgi:predicted transcriptional regulator of viral defense system
MTTDATKQRYSELRAKALGITDRAIAEQRQLTQSEAAEVASTLKEAKGLLQTIKRGSSRWTATSCRPS